MNRRQMLLALDEGKKVRKHLWNKGGYIYMKEDDIPAALYDETDCEVDAENVDLFSSDTTWEIYEEEEKSKIELKPQMVGRAVRLRNGDVRVLEAYRKRFNSYHVGDNPYAYKADGRSLSLENDDDIVEILPR